MIVKKTKTRRYAITAFCLLLSSMTGSCVSAHDTSGLALEPEIFRVGDRAVEGDRGTLQVRENRQHPDSPMIEIAFVRLRHPSGSGEAPIVYLPGGPGQPILGTIDPFVATYLAYVDLGGQGDMLLVEQRGIGASRPRLDCPGLLSRPTDQPLSAAIMGSTHIRYIDQCIAHWEEQGTDLGGYHVVSMADDVDELRSSLGYDKIKLIGESFGTHHALAMIQRHGEHIERAVLSGVIGPDDMFEEPLVVEQQLAKLELADQQSGTPGAGEVDPASLVTSVLRGLDEQPIEADVQTDEGQVSFEIGRYDLALATVTLSRQTAFLNQLPKLYQDIAQGETSWIENWSANIRRGHQTNLASLAITCASGASDQRRATITEQAAKSPLGDAVDLLGADACTPLSAFELGAAFQGPIQGEMPVLLMSAALDTRAPPSNAEALLPGLPNGQHIVFPNVSHDFGQARNAQLRLAYRFLAGGEVPPNLLRSLGN